MSTFAERIAAIETELDDASVVFITGKAKEGMNLQRRRVHFYRMGGTILPPERSGPAVTGVEADFSRYDRLERIECRVMAETEELTSVLFDNVIHAIERAYPGMDHRLNNSEYIWQENEIAQRVPMISFEFGLQFPAVPQTLPMTEVIAVINTPEFEDP